MVIGTNQMFSQIVEILVHCYFPWELAKAKPPDVHGGSRIAILDQCALVKTQTMTKRKEHNVQLAN